MTPIGGYFELADRENGVFLPKEGILLNSGTNALEYILQSITDLRGVWLPYYTCDVVLKPIRKWNIPCFFYHINPKLEIAEDIRLGSGQYIIVNNYFGIKDSYIQDIAKNYGDKVIVDCAQALFMPPPSEMKAFYSCRKFVGVADGGIAYGVPQGDIEQYGFDDSNDHSSHLYIRKFIGAEAGFQSFKDNEKHLGERDIRRMSVFTHDMLEHIDYDRLIRLRRKNYSYLHDRLKDKNMLSLPDAGSFACPMVYPFMCDSARDLRNELISKKIYVARYWPGVLDNCDASSNEYNLARSMLPLPIDQRYGLEEMDYIIDALNL